MLQPLHICKFDVKKIQVLDGQMQQNYMLMAYRVSDLLCFIHYTFEVQASPILQCEFKSRIKCAITTSIHKKIKKLKLKLK
jgi:hypothetical protein